MLFSFLTSFLLGLFLFSTAVDAKTDEFFEMKVFNHDFRASDSEMHAIIEKANLTARGFRKEVTTKLVQNAAGGGAPDYQKAYYYYKDVNCSKMQQVEQELQRLLPGVIGKDIGTKFQTEIKVRHLGSMGMCRVGLEVHFKETESCYEDQKAVSRRRKKRGCKWWCIICINVQININNSGNNNNGGGGGGGGREYAL